MAVEYGTIAVVPMGTWEDISPIMEVLSIV